MLDLILGFLWYLLREWPLAVAIAIVYLVALIGMPPEAWPLLFERKPNGESNP